MHGTETTKRPDHGVNLPFQSGAAPPSIIEEQGHPAAAGNAPSFPQ
jgi:hypothetical protein